jgi:hypothetical protein
MYSGFQAGKSTLGLGSSTSGGQTNAGMQSLSTYQPRDPNYKASGQDEAAAKAQVLRQQALDKVQKQRALRAKELSSTSKTKQKVEEPKKAKPNKQKKPR